MMITLATGQTFTNGQTLHGHVFPWSATLTVVRRDVTGYGVVRYIVRDSYGRHGYAY